MNTDNLILFSLSLAPSLLYLLAITCATRSRRGFSMFEPLMFLFINTLIGITARSIYILVSGTTGSQMILDAESDYLPLAALFATLATISLLIGYFTAPTSRTRTRPSRLKQYIPASSGACVLILGLCGASIAGIVGFAQEIGFNPTRLADYSSKRGMYVDGIRMNYGHWRWLASLATPAFILSFIILLQNRHRPQLMWRLTAGCAFTITLVWAVFTSSRTTMILTGIQAIMITYYMRPMGQQSKAHLTRQLVKWGIPLLALFLLMAALRANRDHREDLTTAISPAASVEKIVGSGNFFGVAKTSITLKRVPKETPHLYGQSLITWLYTPIPRAVWPEKPNVGLGFEYGEKVLGYDMSKLSNGKTPSLPVELYWNFGWTGACLGMLIFGHALGRFYAWFLPLLRNRNSSAIALYVTALYPASMLTMDTNLSAGIARTLIALATMMSLLLIFNRIGSGAPRTYPRRCIDE